LAIQHSTFPYRPSNSLHYIVGNDVGVAELTIDNQVEIQPIKLFYTWIT